MKDNLSIVITIIVLVLLMVLFPLYNFFERQDDMSYNLVLKATTNFADQVMNNGYIDQNMYNNLVNELGNTGNIYDIQIEAHRKVLTKDKDNITGDTYVEQSYIDYNDDIFNSLEKSNGVMDKQLKNNIYLMNENDEIYVKVKNSNTTLAGSLFNSIIVTSSKTRIEVNYGGIIKNNSWAKIDATYKGHIQAPGAPKVTVGGEEVKSGNSIQISYNKFIDTDIEATSVAFNDQDTNIPNETDEKEDSNQVDENNAIRAFYLFREWRMIPGVDDNGVIDGNELRNWIEKALRLAKGVDREKFVYVQLGEVFAKYPECNDNPNWPPKELFAIMEELNSDVLFRNYSTGMFNKRGFTTRGGYDGGDIERDNAAYFEDLKSQCLPLYPHVAKVFGNLVDQYQQMAKEMDDEATIAKLDF